MPTSAPKTKKLTKRSVTLLLLLFFFFSPLILTLFLLSLFCFFLFFPFSVVLVPSIALLSPFRRKSSEIMSWAMKRCWCSDREVLAKEPVESIVYDKLEVPSFDESSNSSGEESAEEQEQEEKSRDGYVGNSYRENENDVRMETLFWDTFDFGDIQDLEDDNHFDEVLLYWKKKERGCRGAN